MKKIVALLLALVMIVAMAACSGSSNSGADSEDTGAGDVDIAAEALANTERTKSEMDPDAVSTKDTLTFASIVDPGKLSSDTLFDLTTYPLAMSIFQYGIRWNYDTNEFYSPVCDSYTMDDDDMGVTFNITPGIMMHDGEEFTAEDFLFSFTAFRADSGLSFLLDFVNIEGSVIIDDYTLDVRFNEVTGPWEGNVQMMPLYSKNAYEEKGSEAFYLDPVSPAAYYLKDWTPGEEIVFEAFDDYFLGAPKIKYMVMKIVSDPTVAFMELQNGDVDLVWNISADQVKSVMSNDDLQLLLTDSNIINFLGMNCTIEPLSDIRVRQAIWQAINLDDIRIGAYDNLVYPVYNIMSDSAIGINEKYQSSYTYPYNVDAAKQLMEDAGYGDGLTLKLQAESTTNNQLVCEQLSAMLGEIGITLDITLSDYATHTSVLYGTDDYELFLNYSEATADSIIYIDNTMLFGLSKPEGSSDGSGVGWAELCAEIRSTADTAKRAELYLELQDYFFEKGCYWIPMNETQNYVACTTELTGFEPKGSLLDFHGVYFK